MTKHTKRKKKTELPFDWVEEEGFDIIPKPPPGSPKVPSDTTLLLKPKAPPRPQRQG